MMQRQTPAQDVENRRVFLQYLAEAGWDVEGWDAARNAGVRVDLDAEAEYAGPALVLSLELLATHSYLTFQASRPDGELVFCLRLYPSGGLAVVLREIVAAQDMLDADNHPRLIKSLIPLCDPLLIETDRGIFRLS
ncbi:MAG: hypothetical protein QOJ84_350 [Bradyrhizobium sp.]|jgi:hypothetical protein|nr:hypothetical protein [Bradyrhizobium sp.]